MLGGCGTNRLVVTRIRGGFVAATVAAAAAAAAAASAASSSITPLLKTSMVTSSAMGVYCFVVLSISMLSDASHTDLPNKSYVSGSHAGGDEVMCAPSSASGSSDTAAANARARSTAASPSPHTAVLPSG